MFNKYNKQNYYVSFLLKVFMVLHAEFSLHVPTHAHCSHLEKNPQRSVNIFFIKKKTSKRILTLLKDRNAKTKLKCR